MYSSQKLVSVVQVLVVTGREDLARQHRKAGGYDGRQFSDATSATSMTNKWTKDEDDGMEYLDKEVECSVF